MSEPSGTEVWCWAGRRREEELVGEVVNELGWVGLGWISCVHLQRGRGVEVVVFMALA